MIINLKHLWLSALAGIVIAVIGVFASVFAGTLLTGMDYGAAVVLGMGMYLCVVVVICTGVILSKLAEHSHSGKSHDK